MSLSDLPSGDKPPLPDNDIGADQDDWRPNPNHFSQSTTPSESKPNTGNTAGVRPVVDIVSCDGADASLIVAAVQLTGADPQAVTTFESWLARVPIIAPRPDIVVLAGAASRIVSQRWVEQAHFVAPDIPILAAVADATIEHAASLVRQGTRGIIGIPADPQRLAGGIDWLVREAAATQTLRHSRAIHRRNFAKLSEGERRVLEVMLTGLANKQIAQQLKIGLRTVELRRSKIMKKMEATSLAQVICHICEADGVAQLAKEGIAVSENIGEIVG